jgi:YHS domain-containing protein
MTHRDPVCGMDVEDSTPHQATHDDQRYYFCSPDCKEAFEKMPQQYTGGVGSRGVH